jgi:hypothetical protein
MNTLLTMAQREEVEKSENVELLIPQTRYRILAVKGEAEEDEGETEEGDLDGDEGETDLE